METTAAVRIAKEPGTWAVSMDLCDAYFHIPIKQDPESFSTGWRSVPVPVAIRNFQGPLVFTYLMEIVASYLKRQGPTLIQYFEDYLKHRLSREELLIYMYLDKAWRSIIKLGLISNTEK